MARVLAAIFPWLVRIEVTLEPHEVNGQPGAIFRDRDGKVLNTWALDVLGGQIQTIRSVQQPRQARARGPGGGRLGRRPRGEPGPAAQGLTGKSRPRLRRTVGIELGGLSAEGQWRLEASRDSGLPRALRQL